MMMLLFTQDPLVVLLTSAGMSSCVAIYLVDNVALILKAFLMCRNYPTKYLVALAKEDSDTTG